MKLATFIAGFALATGCVGRSALPGSPEDDGGAPDVAEDTGAAEDTGEAPADTGEAPADTGPAPTGGPVIGGCRIFPPDNEWNRDISGDPVDARSSLYLQTINNAGETTLKADFGSNLEYGFPYISVPADQPMVPIRIVEYPHESDPGPYPIPLDAPIQGGFDHHVLVVLEGRCMLYEMYHARASGGGWTCGQGSVWDLNSNALRPERWTSTDQAGLPVLPGLVRYDEVTAGEIRHALRFTAWRSTDGWVHPARHAGGGDPNGPPMGARFRLRASYDISGYRGAARVILTALKRYGMFLADTGSNWYISGATDRRWSDSDLAQLRRVPSSALEVVRTGTIRR